MEETKCLEIPFQSINNLSPAKTSHNKRVFTLSEKAALINCSETERLSVKELTERFKCGKTAVYDILKRKSEIFEQCFLGAGSRKRKLRKTANGEINQAVWQWFVEAKSNNFNVTGPLLQAQAKLAAEHLGKTDFKASNGWLESFCTRHCISFRQSTTEQTQIYPVTHTKWYDYPERENFVEVKEEQEYSDPGSEPHEIEIVDLPSSPVVSRTDGESSSSAPITNVSGSSPSVKSQPKKPVVPSIMLPSSVQHPVTELSQPTRAAGSCEGEQTFQNLQERKHQWHLNIMEKEHEMKLEILRIEKETAEINSDIARKKKLRLSEEEDFVEVKKEQEYSDPGSEHHETEIVNLLSSPVVTWAEGESSSSAPITNVSGSLPCVKSEPKIPVVPSIMLPFSVQHPVTELSQPTTKQGRAVGSCEGEQTFQKLQERKHQRHWNIIEKEHEMKLEILRIEKETAEINRDIARKKQLRLSEK